MLYSKENKNLIISAFTVMAFLKTNTLSFTSNNKEVSIKSPIDWNLKVINMLNSVLNAKHPLQNLNETDFIISLNNISLYNVLRNSKKDIIELSLKLSENLSSYKNFIFSENSI